MSKNFENIKVKLSVKEAEELYTEINKLVSLTDLLDNNNLRNLKEILQKTKPLNK